MPDAGSPAEKKRAFDTYDVLVEQTVEITPRNKHIRFAIQGGKSMAYKAGQFVQMFVPHDGTVRRTSYSIASAPGEGTHFELCVTLVDGGVSSTYLHSLKVGDKLQAMGPLGKFTLPEPPPQNLVFIATGSGIAPFRAMINDLLHHKNFGGQIALIFGNRYVPDIIYRDEWEALAEQYKNFHFIHTLSRAGDEWPGAKGYVQERVQEFIAKPADQNFYICGLNKMITQVTDKLRSLGVPDAQIHFERYD